MDSSRAWLSPPWRRLAILLSDVFLFNLSYYYFLRAVLFHQVGQAAAWEAICWGAFFCATILVSGRLQLWGGTIGHHRRTFELGFYLLVAFLISRLAMIEPQGTDTDWSWLRPEMIKTPLWEAMFVPLSPLFFLLFWIGVVTMMRHSFADPRGRVLQILPGVGVVLLSAHVVTAFAGTSWSFRWIYLAMFCGPLTLSWVLLAVGELRNAFRLMPFVFHTMMVCLNYSGALPLHAARDLLPTAGSRQISLAAIPGATAIYPPAGQGVSTAFRFPRKLLATPESILLGYGPIGMSGFMSVDRKTGAARERVDQGLVRDFQQARPGEPIVRINWEESSLSLLDPIDLTVKCQADLNQFSLFTPWNFLQDGRRILITNVTYPVVAELELQRDGQTCSLIEKRHLDFHATGYTRFTDGAFGLYLDHARNRLYVLVALLEGRELVGLVEIDPDTFRIIRDLRLPAGMMIYPIEGSRVLLPSFYSEKIFEVTLNDMRIVRTIAAPPNILSLAYDTSRGLIYATSRAAGVLTAIDYASGRTVGQWPVGAKPQGMVLESAEDRLLLASGLGIVAIDLKKLVANLAQ